jgi:hypothetical protein
MTKTKRATKMGGKDRKQAGVNAYRRRHRERGVVGVQQKKRKKKKKRKTKKTNTKTKTLEPAGTATGVCKSRQERSERLSAGARGRDVDRQGPLRVGIICLKLRLIEVHRVPGMAADGGEWRGRAGRPHDGSGATVSVARRLKGAVLLVGMQSSIAMDTRYRVELVTDDR